MADEIHPPLRLGPDQHEDLPLDPAWPGAVWHFRAGPLRWPRHRHHELEFNLLLRGHARYLIGRRRLDLSPGCLAWFPSDQEHVLLDRSADCSFWIAVFRPALVRRCAAALPAESGNGDGAVRHIAAPWQLLLARSCASLHSAPRPGLRHPGCATASPRLAASGLEWLLRCAGQAFIEAAEGGARHVHPAVAKAVQLLQGSAGTIDGRELALRCGLGRSGLSRRFRQDTGLSLTEHRNRVRLERALTLVQGGHEPNLLHAALAAGFGSYMQFHRVFRARFGVSPREWLAQDATGVGHAGDRS